ncbi:MAG: hypothetical protein ACKVP3_17355 [Hyphomicrobiaceae bacterium]
MLSGLLATLSVTSLITRYWSVGLGAVALEFIGFYRKAIAFVMDPLLSILPFTLPGWYKDAYVLSFILLLLEFKAVATVNKITPGPNTPYLLRIAFINVYLSALLSAFLVGLVAILWKPFEAHGILKGQATAHQRARGTYFFISLGTTFAATVALFAINAI